MSYLRFAAPTTHMVPHVHVGRYSVASLHVCLAADGAVKPLPGQDDHVILPKETLCQNKIKPWMHSKVPYYVLLIGKTQARLPAAGPNSPLYPRLQAVQGEVPNL